MTPLSLSFSSHSSEETRKVGAEIAKHLKAGDVLCLTGDLGAGKTTLTKGIAEELLAIHPDEITSPTFTYLHIYEGPTTLYHFDLYRLPSQETFLQSGFAEFLDAGGICCIEWPDKLPRGLPPCPIHISIRYLSSLEREIIVERISL
jgi:tRNA threonylcarbamoyladenosine biosynthesis protein TsaE